MFNKIKNAILCLTLSTAVSCTTIYRNHGYVPNDEVLANIVIGIDTRASVEDALGIPTIGGVPRANSSTEDILKSSYAAKYPAGAGEKEYKASHILVETEQKARDLLALLDGGADFSGLAIEHSTGPSGPSGGDLGWFRKGRMVAPFESAVMGMEAGTYTGPVKTQFGYHLIFLNNRREASPPSFEDVRDELEAEIQHKGDSMYFVSSRWSHQGLKTPKPIYRQIVAIQFDASDILSNVSRYELSDSKVIVLSRRVTAGGASEISFIRQMMGNFGRLDARDILSAP